MVGCTDVMIGLTAAEGCFLRLYYPSVLKDAYVKLLYSCNFNFYSLSLFHRHLYPVGEFSKLGKLGSTRKVF